MSGISRLLKAIDDAEKAGDWYRVLFIYAWVERLMRVVEEAEL
jgi:hypothetical protein